jgi:hypothetical protein
VYKIKKSKIKEAVIHCSDNGKSFVVLVLRSGACVFVTPQHYIT